MCAANAFCSTVEAVLGVRVRPVMQRSAPWLVRLIDVRPPEAGKPSCWEPEGLIVLAHAATIVEPGRPDQTFGRGRLPATGAGLYVLESLRG